MNKKKAILISLGSLGTLSVGALSAIGTYFYNLALNPKTSKDAILRSTEENTSNSDEVIDEDLKWLNQTSNYTDVYIQSYDNLKLHAYKILNNIYSNKWVIAVHGYMADANYMSIYAKKYYDMGYNILMPDLRTHGKSEGNVIGMGWFDRLDILKWIKLVLSYNKDAKIILHGVSMGAATVAMTSGEAIPRNVKAIIADCGYTSVWEQFSHQLKAIYSLPKFPIMNASSVVTKFKAGYDFKEASTINKVSKSNTPILYIHGDSDDFVPYKMMDELYNATTSPKEKLTIEGAGHARASKVNPDLYWSTIENFINRYINYR